MPNHTVALGCHRSGIQKNQYEGNLQIQKQILGANLKHTQCL